MAKDSGKSASGFKGITDLEYFNFEEDFIENNVRCIPMIVRFKLDRAGIKLHLDEWSKLIIDERIALATTPCNTDEEAEIYRDHLIALIRKRSGKDATRLTVDLTPAWAVTDKLPDLLLEKLTKSGLMITNDEWKGLTDLQRFVLVKLSRPGHENKNFPKAFREFGLTITNK